MEFGYEKKIKALCAASSKSNSMSGSAVFLKFSTAPSMSSKR